MTRHNRIAPQKHSQVVKTIISPSPEASKRHLAAIEQKLQQSQTAPQAQVIAELNPLIVGWAAYYNGVVPAATMSRYDDLVEQRLINWAGKRHPGKALIPYGYIYYVGSRRRTQVKFTAELRDKTRATIARALKVATLKTPPPPLSGKMVERCPDCSLLPLCMPEEVRMLQSKNKT